MVPARQIKVKISLVSQMHKWYRQQSNRSRRVHFQKVIWSIDLPAPPISVPFIK